MGHRTCSFKRTTASGVYVSTACELVGVFANAGGAGTLLVYDGTSLICTWVGTAGEHFDFTPGLPIAIRTNISVTNSGTMESTIFYSKLI